MTKYRLLIENSEISINYKNLTCSSYPLKYSNRKEEPKGNLWAAPMGDPKGSSREGPGGLEEDSRRDRQLRRRRKKKKEVL